MIGMLWFDNDPNADLKTKVERAAAYYQHKYGRCPTLIAAHKSIPETTVGDIHVLPRTGMLKNHFLVRHDHLGGEK